MVHMRNWTLDTTKASSSTPSSALSSESQRRPERHAMQIGDLISDTARQAIDSDFHSLMQEDGYRTFNSLPSANRYLPMIVECYNSMFYSQGRRPRSCPGPLKCKIPPLPGVRCSIAERTYMRFAINWRTRLYLPVDSGRFKVRPNGCTL